MRGYQRKVIHIKNTGSYLFDEAYFVLSRDGEDLRLGEDDMVTEANRIINDKSYKRIKGGTLLRYKRQIISLTIGIMIGALVSLLIFYLTQG
jgi:hypothetical protein